MSLSLIRYIISLLWYQRNLLSATVVQVVVTREQEVAISFLYSVRFIYALLVKLIDAIGLFNFNSLVWFSMMVG